MRVRRRLSVAFAAIGLVSLGMLGASSASAAPTLPHAAALAQPKPPIPAATPLVHDLGVCINNGAGTPCLNNWGGNTSQGAAIKMYAYNNGNENFAYVPINPCNYPNSSTIYGEVSSTCPFTVGTGLNTDFEGDAIVEIEGGGSWCVATASNASAINGSCGDANGNGAANGTMMILNGSPTTCIDNDFCAATNRYWSDQRGTAAFMCSDGLSNGVSVYLDYAGDACGSGDNYWFDFGQ